MKKYISVQERRKIIDEYSRSDLSKTKFCQKRKLALTTFCKWLKKEDLMFN